MDMQNPALTPEQEPQAQHSNDASATAAEAGINDTAADPKAELEAEEIMSEGLEEEAVTTNAEVTAESLLAAANALLEKDAADISGDELRRLVRQYSMLHTSGTPTPDDADTPESQTSEATAFLNAIEQIKAKKAAWVAEQAALRAANLERKNAIIEEIIALAGDTDNVNRTFTRYRELQDEFNATGDVEPEAETAVWKRFQEAREQYSDNLKINKELRDYDFKKNLSDKEALIAEAAALAAIEDVISAYRQLQDLHIKWRQIGPVAKELREEIWAKFREASADVNKRYQAFFEARKAREAENEAAKTALCDQIEAIDITTLKNYAAWEEATRTIQAMQEQWRSLGFASKKMNRALFGRFRTACDAFFTAKAEYYRSTRETLSANLAAKQALVDKAEALRDSTDWRAATDAFVAMQKEWKTTGPVPKKYSDELWKRFTTACDTFFDNKKKAGSSTRHTENANLHAKKEIVAKILAIPERVKAGEIDKDAALAELRQLQESWKEIGHVPFREKDRIYDAFRAGIDQVRTLFAAAENRARRARFQASVEQIEGDDNKIYREREKLVRALEARRADLKNFENNLGFLSSKSKAGNSLVQDMERRIERLKADIAELGEKIAILDSKLK